MDSLYNQISPSLTSVPASDQTFRQYVEELLKAPSTFTSPFADKTKSTSSETTPTTSITEGLFNKFLPKESSLGNTAVEGPTSTIPFGSAQSVVDLTKAAQLLNSPIGKAVGMFTGLPVGLAGNLASLAGDLSWNKFNNNIDQSQNAFDTAAMLGGVGTRSDAYGNVQSISNQDMIDAYDRAMFGVTGSDLNTARESSLGGGPYGASDNSNRSDPSSVGSMADTAND